jgi:hypothetical protein
MHLLQGGKVLTKLLPEQVAKFWDVIKYSVEMSLPPIVSEHPDKMNRILSDALCGGMEVWVSHVREEGVNRFEGVVLTKVIYDNASDTKNLLMYCLYGYDKVSSWQDGYKTLAKYAVARGCAQMVAYTKVPHMVKMARALGGNTDYTFISFDVKETVQKLNELNT